MEKAKNVVSRQSKLESWPIPKLVLNLSIPIMLSLMVQSMYNIVDSMFVARISEQAMTATSLGFSAQLLMISVSVGIGVGINSLLSRTLGKQKYDEANEVAKNGMFVGICAGILFLLLGVYAVPGFVRLNTTDPVLIELGVQYLQICMTFSMGLFLSIVCERLLQATGRAMHSMICQISGCVINIVLDPMLIFGFGPVPALGVRGAAIATVAGQFFAAGLALFMNLKFNHDISLEFRGFRPNGRIIGDLFKVSLPNMLVSGLGSIVMVFMNRYLISYTTTAVACYGVYFKLKSFVTMPASGLSQGMIPIVGYNYGAKRGKKIVDACVFGLGLALAVMVIGLFLFQIFPKQLMRMYDAEGELLSMGTYMLRIISLGFIPTGLALVMDHSFSGMGKATKQMWSNIIRQVGVLPLAYLFGSVGGLKWVWFAIPVAELLALIYSGSNFLWLYNREIRRLHE